MTRFSRRSFTRGTGAGACVLCVAGCSTQSPTRKTATAPDPADKSASPSPTPVATVAADLGDEPVSTFDPVSGEQAFLIKSDGAVSMLSAVCTHAGCIVKWSASQRHFACPCHRGTYDVDGSVLSGPPPEPLREIPVRVEGGEIFRDG